jgi:peptidoglycan L-alanyl-D-glutamate endopeptidase CwlK
MSKFHLSKSSKAKLATCDERLQAILNEAIKRTIINFGVSAGHRDEETQNGYYNQGASKLFWPNSKHNSKPSMAVDVFIYMNGRATWNDEIGYNYLSLLFKLIAHEMGHKLTWGGDWKSFIDMFHFQLEE